MKTAGIIGGLGPETTSKFYMRIIQGCYDENKEQRPPLLIWNVPLDLDIEEDLLKKSKGQERYISYLTDAAEKLEKAGADFLVMPCNTLHIFIDEIRDAVDIPVLNIAEETVNFLKKKGIDRVGILATSTTINNNLYKEMFKEEGIEQVRPNDFDQAKIGQLINNLVLEMHSNKDREGLIDIIDKFQDRDVENVILACTDLQILIPEHENLEIYDTMKIFADSTVKKILE